MTDAVLWFVLSTKPVVPLKKCDIGLEDIIVIIQSFIGQYSTRTQVPRFRKQILLLSSENFSQQFFPHYYNNHTNPVETQQMLKSTPLCRLALAARTTNPSLHMMLAPSQMIRSQPNQQHRTFSQSQIHREEEEEDEEEKAKREKLAKLHKPAPLAGMVPRRRSSYRVSIVLFFKDVAVVGQ